MSNIQIESDLKEVLGKINQKLEKISEDVTELKVGQVKLEGKVEALDEKLSGQIKSVDEKLTGKIEALDEKLSGQIKSVDERLSGKIEAIDEKFTGQIKSLDTKVEQLDKRISNSELTNRGVLIGLVVVILGGAAKLFGLVGNP